MKVKAALLAMAMRRARVSLMLLALELNMKQREFIKTARQEIFGAEVMAEVIDWEGMNVRNPLI